MSELKKKNHVFIVVGEYAGVIGVFLNRNDAEDEIKDLEEYAKALGQEPEDYYIEDWRVY